MRNLQRLHILLSSDPSDAKPKTTPFAQLSNNKFYYTSWAPLVLTNQNEKLQPLTVSIAVIAKHCPL